MAFGVPTILGQIPGIAESQLNSLLGFTGSGVGASAIPRSAMVFTSTLRQAIKTANPSVARAGRISAVPSPASGATQVPPTVFQGEGTRTPPDPGKFFMNTSAIQRNIVMAVNPKSVRFRQPKRMSKRDVMNGSYFMHFTNSKGQNNDVLTIDFRGNTGSIDVTGAFADPANPSATVAAGNGALAKIAAWHNLYLLTREPNTLDNGQENIITISYSSPLIPVVIDFHGFFNANLDFEETGEKPNSRDYSMSFTVTSTTPDLDCLLLEIQSVFANLFVSPANASNAVGTFGAAASVPQDATLVNL